MRLFGCLRVFSLAPEERPNYRRTPSILQFQRRCLFFFFFFQSPQGASPFSLVPAFKHGRCFSGLDRHPLVGFGSAICRPLLPFWPATSSIANLEIF